MTRKDYILLAEALKAVRDGKHTYADIGLDRATISIANALAADNPRFDRARFLKAAGVAP